LKLRPIGLVAGIDEAGRGPLAGPVVAAAVILDPKRRINGLADSKILAPEVRTRIAGRIRDRAIGWGVGVANVAEIDALNIYWATMLAMQRAVSALPMPPHEVWVDGNRCPDMPCAARAIVKGDRDVAVISAASIIAKTVRDAMLVELDRAYPKYGFAQHKGYSTRGHLQALAEHGPCPAHRRSFVAVAQADQFDFGF
jgi:ribonuclease HII